MHRGWKREGMMTIVLLVVGILAGALLLTLAYCIPVNMGSYYATERSVELEGYYPNVPIVTNTYNTYFQTFLPGVLDNATVRTYMLPMTYETGENPLFLAMNCRGYSYYWHGYVTILRPLQLIFNYEEMQLANDFCQIALIVVLAVLIGRRMGMKHVIMLISCYILTMPMAVSICLQYSAVFYIAYGACLILIWKQDWLSRGTRYFYFFLVIGMLTSYFDLLTYPLITWGIPAVWWLIVEQREIGILNSLKRVVAKGIAWILGYGVMWFGKWVLASLVLNKNIIVEALNEILLRTGVENEVTFGQTNRLYAIYMNWKHYNYKLYVLILLGWLLYWLVCGLIKGWKKADAGKCCSLLLIGCSSFVWYIVLFNHTQIHHAFSYRIFGISIAAFFAIVLESTCHVRVKRAGIRHYVTFCAKGIVMLGAACLLTLCAREITQIDNKSQPFETSATKGEQVRIRFVPQYDRIIALGIGIQTESDKGWYEISVCDGETELYRETVPVTYYEGNNYRDINVDWSMEAGKEYLVTLDVYDVDDEVYIYYTSDGHLPLEGCQYYEGDSLTMSQPLIGLQYWCLPVSLKTKGLLVLSYLGLLFTVFYVGECLFGNVYDILRSKGEKGVSPGKVA